MNEKILSIESAKAALARRKVATQSGTPSGGPDLFSLSLVASGAGTEISVPRASPSPLPLKAYLACALTGLDDVERSNIFAISDLVAEVCAAYGVDLFEPRKHTDPVLHAGVTPFEVYSQDKLHVHEADLLVHLCHHPSTGSGEELEFARAALIPIILVTPTTVKVSRMILGIPSLLLEVNYKDPDDLQTQLGSALLEFRPVIEERKLAFSNYRANVVGQKMIELRQRQGLTRADVANASHKITETRLSEIESSHDLDSNPSLVELREIATILKTTVSELVEPNFAEQVFSQIKAWTEGRQAARGYVSESDQKKMLKALLHRLADNI
jgi:transcriptional regulator with XRE-family HTH domain